MTREVVLQLQNDAGNRAVNRLLTEATSPDHDEEPTSGAAREGAATEVAAAIAGLQRGDGFKSTRREALRPRVELLQERLNEHMLAALKVDGLFGPLTEQALIHFQESIRVTPGQPIDEVTARALEASETWNPELPVPPVSPTVRAQSESSAQASEDLEQAARVMSQCGFKILNLGSARRDGSPEEVQEGLAVELSGQKIAAAGATLTGAGKDLGEQSRQRLEPKRSTTGGNPLVGIQRGDGIKAKTADRRSRVRLLQERLNLKVSAGLDLDGMFGEKTAEALRGFQATRGHDETEVVSPDAADELLDLERGPDVGRVVDLLSFASGMGDASSGWTDISIHLQQHRFLGSTATEASAAATELRAAADKFVKAAIEDLPASRLLRRAGGALGGCGAQLAEASDFMRIAGEQQIDLDLFGIARGLRRASQAFSGAGLELQR